MVKAWQIPTSKVGSATLSLYFRGRCMQRIRQKRHQYADLFSYNHMKIKHKALMAVLLAAVCLTACDKEEEYHEEYSSIEGEDAYTIVQNDLISTSFRVIELAEVFTGYQEIRSNREMALSFVESYFNTRRQIYYEFMDIDYWGKITLMDDGSFIVKPSYWKNYWIALNTPRELHIQSPQEHIYSAESTSDKGTWNIEAEVSNRYTKIYELTVDLKSDIFGTVKIALNEPLEMPMCKNGKGKLEPVSGKITITYRSNYADHVFEVEYNKNGKKFIMPDGTVKDVDPAPAYGYNEY